MSAVYVPDNLQLYPFTSNEVPWRQSMAQRPANSVSGHRRDTMGLAVTNLDGISLSSERDNLDCGITVRG